MILRESAREFIDLERVQLVLVVIDLLLVRPEKVGLLAVDRAAGDGGGECPRMHLHERQVIADVANLIRVFFEDRFHVA